LVVNGYDDASVDRLRSRTSDTNDSATTTFNITALHNNISLSCSSSLELYLPTDLRQPFQTGWRRNYLVSATNRSENPPLNCALEILLLTITLTLTLKLTLTLNVTVSEDAFYSANMNTFLVN